MEFISLDMLLSLGGCFTVVMIVTEALKKYFTKINALWLNLICSVIIGCLRILVIKDFTLEGIITGVLNTFVIMLAAGGGYDFIKNISLSKGEKK